MNIDELKSELELLYENSIELRDYTDNPELYSEIDVKVVNVLDIVLFNIESMISDIDDGIYEEDEGLEEFEEE